MTSKTTEQLSLTSSEKNNHSNKPSADCQLFWEHKGLRGY